MPNVTKKNLIIMKSIIVWKWNHLFTKNYFRKKKINYCYGFMPGDSQIICFSMVGENRRSPVSTETPEFKCRPEKIVKHTQTIHRQQTTNCLSVFDHFVGLALKGLGKYGIWRILKSSNRVRVSKISSLRTRKYTLAI